MKKLICTVEKSRFIAFLQTYYLYDLDNCAKRYKHLNTRKNQPEYGNFIYLFFFKVEDECTPS